MICAKWIWKVRGKRSVKVGEVHKSCCLVAVLAAAKFYVQLCDVNRTADSKLNNFTRLEPILHLLGIPFDTNVARDVMTERHGMATRLLYQMYIALNNKKKANLTGVAMETQRPAAPAKLNAIESGIYKEVSLLAQW